MKMPLNKKEMEKLVGFKMRRLSGIGVIPDMKIIRIQEKASVDELTIASRKAEKELRGIFRK